MLQVTFGESLDVFDVAANTRREVPAPLQALAEGKAMEDYDVEVVYSCPRVLQEGPLKVIVCTS